MNNNFGIDLAGRLPVFDIKVKVQKQSAVSKLSQNELAKEFYKLGFFEPSRANSALACLDMMDFDGKDIISDKISQKNAMFANYSEMYSKLLELASIVEKEHPDLSGLLNGFAQKFSPSSFDLSNTNGIKYYNTVAKSQTRMEKAKQKALDSASPL